MKLEGAPTGPETSSMFWLHYTRASAIGLDAFQQWRAEYLRDKGREPWPLQAGHLARVIVAGSHAYGMATETSDFDFAGFTMPPRRVWSSHRNEYEQTIFGCPLKVASLDGGAEGRETKGEGTIYSLRKFVNLACQANPNIIEQLWVDPSSVVYESPVGAAIVEARDLFMSRKLRWTFSGYAMAQMKKIQLHRAHLQSPPKARPERADFGLGNAQDDKLNKVKAAIQKRVDGWALDLDGIEKDRRLEIQERIEGELVDLASWVDWRNDTERMAVRAQAAGLAIGLPDEWLDKLTAEYKYKVALDHWNKYQQWLKNRNPDRAALEAVSGYDTKHGAHVVRLVRQGLEALQTGKMQTRRPDAEELLAIRRGAWTFDQLAEFVSTMDAQYAAAEATSPLPRAVDHEKIEGLMMRLVWGDTEKDGYY